MAIVNKFPTKEMPAFLDSPHEKHYVVNDGRGVNPESRHADKLREMMAHRPPGEVYQVELAILELADRLEAIEARLKADDAALWKW